MGKFIVKLHDYYFEYSTITDSPVMFGMKLEEFKDWYAIEYGIAGLSELKYRLERVELCGTSDHERQVPEDLMWLNRAGPNEEELSVDEIYKAYCLRQPIRDGWIVPTSEHDEWDD